jgi:N-acetylneuraminate epimerase
MTRSSLLDKPDGPWRVLGKLPKPNGYGVSITTPEGLVIVGGGNATEHFREVFWLEDHVALPPLPKPCAFMSGCVLDDVIYIAGGIETPTATSALNTFWSLHLKKLDAPMAGTAPLPRQTAHSGLHGRCGRRGASVQRRGFEARPRWQTGARVAERCVELLQTGHTAGKKLPDMPRVAVAAPNPAPVVDGKILIIGGDDGANVNFEPKSKHPGFPRDVLAFRPQNAVVVEKLARCRFHSSRRTR